MSACLATMPAPCNADDISVLTLISVFAVVILYSNRDFFILFGFRFLTNDNSSFYIVFVV